MSYKKVFHCVVCDYMTDSKKGLSVHISRKARSESKITSGFNLFAVIDRIYNEDTKG